MLSALKILISMRNLMILSKIIFIDVLLKILWHEIQKKYNNNNNTSKRIINKDKYITSI